MLKTRGKKLWFTIVTVLMLSLVCNAALAYVDYELLSIPVSQQEKSNWCWAACTQMVCKFYGENPSQADIVTFTFGSPVNQGGNINHMGLALANWNVGATGLSGKLTYTEIEGDINSGSPIIVGRNGHAEVIRGFYTDTSNNKYNVYFIDPWDGSYNIVSYPVFSSTWDGGTLWKIWY